MKIKRYMALSMRNALAKVREEQGPDAVILSSRRVEEGIEVIAAVDYDEALFAEATRQRAAIVNPLPPHPEVAAMAIAGSVQMPTQVPALVAPVAAAARATPATRALSATHAAQMPAQMPSAASIAAVALQTEPQAPVAAPSAQRIEISPASTDAAPRRAAAEAAPRRATPSVADLGYLAMRREMKELRSMLEGQFSSKKDVEKRPQDPLQARVLASLLTLDIAADVAASLALQTPKNTVVGNPSSIALALLAKHLPVIEDQSTVNGGVIALVGPTGVGKTTTIAKLAARWTMKYGNEEIALISMDGHRVGAREQLMTYARILGVPMHAVNSGAELARTIERVKRKKVVLIDTVGMGSRDERLSEQLNALRGGAPHARVLLALPAQGELNALDELVRSYGRIKPAGCVVTKVDEAASLGGLLSATMRHKLKIGYVCDGQRVPEDIHIGRLRRVWLVSAALQYKEESAPRGNTYLVQNSDRAPIHA